jgi:Fe-S-cluster containining protein
MSKPRILRNHPLKQFTELKVGEDIFTTRYASGCSMSNCHGICCADGVDVDIAERDRILEHADMIRQYMDETQDRDTANWFQEPKPDADFPSGQCTTTRLKSNGCNFLNKHGQCVVHMAEAKAPPGFGYLKPFFCRAFPVCILNSTLSVDDEQCPDERGCCGPVKNGPLSILDTCAFELEYMLGKEGYAELLKMAADRAKTSEQPSDTDPVPA